MNEGAGSLNILLNGSDSNREYLSLVEQFNKRLLNLTELAKGRITDFANNDINPNSILASLQWRLDGVIDEFNCKAYELGVKLAELELQEQI